MCFSSPGASTRSRLVTDAIANTRTYAPAPAAPTISAILASACRPAIRAPTYVTARAPAARTPPRNASSVNGFRPSLTMGVMRSLRRAVVWGGGTRHGAQRVGALHHEPAGAAAAPVPPAPLGGARRVGRPTGQKVRPALPFAGWLDRGAPR